MKKSFYKFRQILEYKIGLKFNSYQSYKIFKDVLDIRFNKYSDKEKQLIKSLRLYKPSVLLTGFQKSGNTWFRFIVYNYFNILLNNVNKTLTYKDLNNIQCHMPDANIGSHIKKVFLGFIRTHRKYEKVFDYFDWIIYIHRNPMDTLISLYFYLGNRTIPFQSYPKKGGNSC